MSVFIVAEAGSCHGGSPLHALRLVEVAKEAGADCVKFQFYSSPERLAERRRMGADAVETYRRYQLPAAWLPTLADYAQRQGLEFMCTAFLPEDIAVVAPFVSRFKVASLECQDAAFIERHLEYGKPVIVSTGCTDQAALGRLHAQRAAAPAGQISLLHCIAAYPAPPEDLNLAVIAQEHLDGFSDHSRHVFTGAFAVMAGGGRTRILEVHFRLPENGTEPGNPDFPHSLDPWQLGEYVRFARHAETALGDGVKRPMPSELPLLGHVVGGSLEPMTSSNP